MKRRTLLTLLLASALAAAAILPAACASSSGDTWIGSGVGVVTDTPASANEPWAVSWELGSGGAAHDASEAHPKAKELWAAAEREDKARTRLALLEQAWDADPRHGAIQNEIGRAHIELGDRDAARAAFEAAIAAESDHAPARANLYRLGSRPR